MRSQRGLTLVEMLIALGVLGVVFAITAGGVTTNLRVQRTQEAVTSSQAKLRRITEVFTQELRSAVMGGISNQPIVSDDTSISFTLLTGGAGYQVLPHDSGNNNSFKQAANVQIIATVNNASELGLEGGQALMINDAGQAVIFDVGNVTRRGGFGSLEYDVVHPGCSNTIDYTENTLLFAVQTVGFDYDADTGTLFQQVGNGARVPLAFDLSTFRIDYIYEADDGTLIRRAAPLLTATGAPARTGTIGGRAVTLRRLQLVLGANADVVGGNSRERRYSSQIELATTSTSRDIQAVETCN